MENSKKNKAVLLLFCNDISLCNDCLCDKPLFTNGHHIENAFQVPESLAQVGNYGNFGAYLLMGVPAGMLIDKIGYKKTALAALVVGVIGLLIQWVSGSWASLFTLSVLSSRVFACVCLIQ